MLSTTDSVSIHSLRHVAIKGLTAQKRRDEVFVSGTIKGDRMTLVFKSQSLRSQHTGRHGYKTHMRIVTCHRLFSPSHADFWWEGVTQQTVTF